MLRTWEVSELLKQQKITLSPADVANFARKGLFTGAVKDKKGNWIIPRESVAEYVQMHIKKQRITKRLITFGSIATLVTILTIISVAKDSLDLFFTYLLPSKASSTLQSPTSSSAPTPPFPNEFIVNQELVWGNNTVIIESVRLDGKNLIIHFAFDIGNMAWVIETCPLPYVAKSGYGDLKPSRGGGVFATTNTLASNEASSCRLVTLPNGRPEGWAEYEIDPNLFQIQGTYSVELDTNEYEPPIVFDIR